MSGNGISKRLGAKTDQGKSVERTAAAKLDSVVRSQLEHAVDGVRRGLKIYECQRRSKSTPLAGVKMHHLMRFSPALAVVPVVHRRDPRCFVQRLRYAKRSSAGPSCGPTGSTMGLGCQVFGGFSAVFGSG